MEKFTLTSEQLKAARMLLRWVQTDLAEKSGISLPVVKRVESEPGEIRALESTIDAFRRAFQKEGILFISGQFHGAVLSQNRAEPDTQLRKSPLKQAKIIKMVFKKRATPNPKV